MPQSLIDTPAFDAVLGALPVGVAIIDARQRIVLINPAYCAALGMPPGSFPAGTPLSGNARLGSRTCCRWHRPGRQRRAPQTAATMIW